MHRLFFFGSLRDRDVLRVVIGRNDSHLVRTPAWLPGHAVNRVAGHVFPMIVPRPGAVAQGVVVDGLTGRDLERINWFEDTDYALRPFDLTTDGGPVTAPAYVATGKLTDSGEAWHLDVWARTEKAFLLEAAAEYLSLHGTCTMAEAEALWDAIAARVTARLASRGIAS